MDEANKGEAEKPAGLLSGIEAWARPATPEEQEARMRARLQHVKDARAKLHPRVFADMARALVELGEAAYEGDSEGIGEEIYKARKALMRAAGIAFVKKYGIE